MLLLLLLPVVFAVVMAVAGVFWSAFVVVALVAVAVAAVVVFIDGVVVAVAVAVCVVLVFAVIAVGQGPYLAHCWHCRHNFYWRDCGKY